VAGPQYIHRAKAGIISLSIFGILPEYVLAFLHSPTLHWHLCTCLWFAVELCAFLMASFDFVSPMAVVSALLQQL
jgi:hypothetical protein